jgi:hypothetical protein
VRDGRLHLKRPDALEIPERVKGVGVGLSRAGKFSKKAKTGDWRHSIIIDYRIIRGIFYFIERDA